MIELAVLSLLIATLTDVAKRRRNDFGRVIGCAEEIADAVLGPVGDDEPRPELMPHGVKRIGIGETRLVYQVGDLPYVIKVPRSPLCVAFNAAEAEAFETAPARVKKYLLPVLASDPSGRWLVMPFAEAVLPVQGETFCDDVLEDVGQDVFQDLWYANVRRYQGKLYVIDYPDDLGNAPEEPPPRRSLVKRR